VSAWAVYLSPHLDDAVLSCGGLIHRQATQGTRVLVATIFAGHPPPNRLSTFASAIQTKWGIDGEPSRIRRREDRAALNILGADLLHFDYLDAIYRSDGDSFLYLSDEELFGLPHPLDTELCGDIESSLSKALPLHQFTLYAPLGVGNHVDHQLARRARLSLSDIPARVVLYEDYPYAEKPGALTYALESASGGDWNPETAPLDEENLKAKIKAVAAYRSQVDSLFGGEERMRRRVCDYARAISPTQGLAERYWTLTGSLPVREFG
jgi:LmbE family N-acetylglucosaminyl deacetylase